MRHFPPRPAVTVLAVLASSIPARGEKPPVPAPLETTGPGMAVLSYRPDGAVRVRLTPDLLARLPKPADAPEGGRAASFLLHRILPSLAGPSETFEIGAGDAVDIPDGTTDLDLFAGDAGFVPGPYRIGLHPVIEGTPGKAETAGTRFWRGRMDEWAAEIEREHAGLRALLDEWKGKGDEEDKRRLHAAGEYRHFETVVDYLRRMCRKQEDRASKIRAGADAAKEGTAKGKPPAWLTAETVSRIERGAGGGKNAGAAPPGVGGGPGPGGAPVSTPAASTSPATRDGARDLLARQALALLFLAAEFTASRPANDPGDASAAAADWTRLADLDGRITAADPLVKRLSDELQAGALWRIIPSRLPEPVGAEGWRAARDLAEKLRAGLRRTP